jgi:hypothetical protein
MYDPHRDLYAVLGVSAGALPQEIRGAICRRYATARAHDLEEASRLLLSGSLRARYDLERRLHRVRVGLRRVWRSFLGLPVVVRLFGDLTLPRRHRLRR